MTAMLSEIAPNKTVELPTTMKRDGAKRLRVYYGPFEILGAEAARKAINRKCLDERFTLNKPINMIDQQ
jgi:hypothetical protein